MAGYPSYGPRNSAGRADRKKGRSLDPTHGMSSGPETCLEAIGDLFRTQNVMFSWHFASKIDVKPVLDGL